MIKKSLWHIRNAYLHATAELFDRSLPDFILIGGQKCGTTFLEDAMIKHPHFIPPYTIGLNYFARDFQKPLSLYKSQFASKRCKENLGKRLGGNVVQGEFKPYYMPHPHAAKRMYDLMPDIKLVVLLRNPVDRTLSHYFHNVKYGLEDLSLEEALDREDERLAGEVEKLQDNPDYYSKTHRLYSYKARSRYWEQLEGWYKFFAPEQFLLLRSEEMFEKPQNTLNSLCDFLNIPKFDMPDDLRRNEGDRAGVSPDTIKRLDDYFTAYNKGLFDQADIKL